MPPSGRNAAKIQILRRQGVLNPHPQAVTDPLFQTGDFFDAHDLLQVKYEMLRRVDVDKALVTEAAAAFGLSRPTFYQAQHAFAQQGLGGLIPRKRGPRGAHKLTPAVLGAPAARGIAVVDHWRTHERYSAGVWACSSPAHSRAAFGPAGKKTSLIFATTDACSHVDLRGLYEQLRRRVLEGGRRVPGCALIQRQGMKGWIESCLQFFRPSVPVCVPHEPPAAEIPFCDDVVHLIASMVLEIHQQGAIS